jgi:glycosyltransferase involved in cell wall biosynthesis
MKTKICYIIGELRTAGAETLIYNVLKNINKSKYDVILVYNKEGNFSKEFKALDIQLYKLPLHVSLKNIKNIFTLKGILKKNNIDIVHIHLVGNFMFALLASILGGIRSRIIHWHNPYYRNNLKFNRRFSLTAGNRLSTGIIAISEKVKSYNAHEYDVPLSKVRVVYNSIDVGRFDLKKDEREEGSFKIGTIGRLTEQKGYNTLIKSMSFVNKQYPNIMLEIIGDGPMRDQIVSQIKDLGLNNNIKLINSVKYDDIPRKIQEWDAFVITSNWEGFGLVIIEAMACGLPVIATGVDAIPEIVIDGETGLLVEPGNSEAISKCIIELYHDRKKIQQYGAAGRRRVEEHFTIENFIKQLDEIYSQGK